MNNRPVIGVGFAGLLTLIFITLKLTHVINWNWFWILSPIIIQAILIIIIAIIVISYFHFTTR